MTNKDKVIVAFLVSAGLFSLTQAKQYVHNLSDTEKQTLKSVTKNPLQKALVSLDPFETQGTQNQNQKPPNQKFTA